MTKYPHTQIDPYKGKIKVTASLTNPDLVKALQYKASELDPETQALMLKAADEIERLQARIEGLRNGRI